MTAIFEMNSNVHNLYVYSVLSGFFFGVLMRSFFDFGVAFALFILFLGLLVSIFGYIESSRHVVIATGLMLIALTGGYIRMHSATPLQSPLLTHVGTEVVLEGVVTDDPDRRNRTQHILLETADGENVLVRTDVHRTISYGDTLRIIGTLEIPENFEGDTGRVFNYQGFLAKDDIRARIAFPEVDVIEQRGGNVLYRTLFAIKHQYLDALARTIPEPGAALAGGITVGDKQALGGELQDDFRKTGLIHIVVLSGYNVTIIIVFFTFLFALFPRNTQYVLAAIGIVLFTLLVGASATVVRAAIMGIIAAIALISGRTYDIARALLIAGFLMLLWNPYLLAFDPSFQLSFIATLGLIFGTPLLVPYLSRVPEAFHFREITAATIATQIAVIPALIYMMGEVSLVALPVNILVLPVVPLAMLFVFIAGALGMFATVLSLPFAWLAHGLLLYVLEIVDVFASVRFASMTVPEIPIWLIGAMYLILGAIVFRLTQRQSVFR